MTETKRCRTCWEMRPLTDFHIDNDKKTGRRATCRFCRYKNEFRRGHFTEYEVMMLDEFRTKEVLGGLSFDRSKRMGQLLAGLHDKGLLERITDKKPYFYKLTKKGKKRLDKELETAIIENRGHEKYLRMLEDEFEMFGIEMKDKLYKDTK